MAHNFRGAASASTNKARNIFPKTPAAQRPKKKKDRQPEWV